MQYVTSLNNKVTEQEYRAQHIDISKLSTARVRAESRPHSSFVRAWR